jgi:CRP-like cAMP-binding protein
MVVSGDRFGGLLKHLSQTDFDLVNTKAIKLDKKPGDAVALSGEPVAGIFWVNSGQVGVYPPGSDKAFTFLEKGAAFGEMSFLDGSKASATIRIEEPGAEIAMISHAVLHQLIKGSPSIGNGIYRGIAESLAEKLRVTNLKISAEISKTRHTLSEGVQGFIAAIERTIQF